MKKSFVLMAMAGVALASCVNDEVADVVQKNEKVKITFDSPVLYNTSDSRANYFGEIGTHTYEGSTAKYTYPKEEDFVIYAVCHSGDFAGWASATPHEMNGKSIKYYQDVDGWAPKTADNKYYYWPEGKMSFAATSPAELSISGSVTRTYDAAGLKITGFEIASDPAKQYDLLFSTRTVNKTSADMLHSANYYSGIPINFQHALSSIRFSIKNETDANVILKEIRLGGVQFKGDFSENITEDATDYTKYESGTGGNVAPSWTLGDGRFTTNNGYQAFSGSVEFPIEAQYVASLAASDTDADDEVEVSNHLLLLPQTLTEDVVLYVSYTVNGQSHSKTAKLSGLKDKNNVAVNTWEMGVRYTYRLVYSDETADKDKIYFAPGSADWVEHDVIIVEL